MDAPGVIGNPKNTMILLADFCRYWSINFHIIVWQFELHLDNLGFFRREIMEVHTGAHGAHDDLHLRGKINLFVQGQFSRVNTLKTKRLNGREDLILIVQAPPFCVAPGNEQPPGRFVVTPLGRGAEGQRTKWITSGVQTKVSSFGEPQ